MAVADGRWASGLALCAVPCAGDVDAVAGNSYGLGGPDADVAADSRRPCTRRAEIIFAVYSAGRAGINAGVAATQAVVMLEGGCVAFRIE